MGIIKGFKISGLFAKLAFCQLVVAAVFAWIAYTCTGWGEAKAGTHYGLWRICSDDKYTPACVPTDGWANDWVTTWQALITLGFLGINVALLLLILYTFVPNCQKNGEVAMTTAIICIVTGLLYLSGVILFATKFTQDFIYPADSNPAWDTYKLGYCLGLSVPAILLQMLAGILVILDSKKGGTSPSA